VLAALTAHDETGSKSEGLEAALYASDTSWVTVCRRCRCPMHAAAIYSASGAPATACLTEASVAPCCCAKKGRSAARAA
jgi:hypothetical protein